MADLAKLVQVPDDEPRPHVHLLSIRVNDDDYKALQRMAEREERPVGNLARRLLREAVAAENEKAA